jgi:Tol biopolymer transport system component
MAGLLVAVCLHGVSFAAFAATLPASLPMAKPEIFAPGVISAGTNVLAPAFSPDGRSVYFTSATPTTSTILVSHRQGDHWSSPQVAPFSGQWRDLEPAMAPDGSFLIFASGRPVTADGHAIDGAYEGKTWPAMGGNLWRVDRHGDGWGAPQRLPAAVNGNTSVFSPSIAADGSLYFMQPDPDNGHFHIWHAAYVHGQYQAPVRVSLGDASSEDVDPAIAPDQSFIVFSQRHPQKADRNRLQIAFRHGDGWGIPVDLGDVVNGASGNIEARLGTDGRTLYFSSPRNEPESYPRTPAAAKAFVVRMQAWDNGTKHIWRMSLAPWLDARLASRGVR